MNAKEELKEFVNKKNDGKRILEQYELFFTRATKITASFSQAGGRTNLPSDKVGDNAIKMADLHSQYLTTFLEAEQYKLKILLRIIDIPEPYKKILWFLYVDDVRFSDIPSLIGYSPSQTKRLLKKALREFEKDEPK